MTRQISRKISLLALAAIAFTTPTQANVVIDGFDVIQSITAPPTTFGFVDGPTSSIIGGQRDVTVSRTSGPQNVQFATNIVPSVLLFSTDFGTSGLAVIQYDGVDNSSAFNPTGLGGIDVTQSGANKGLSITGGADQAGVSTILFELFTNATQSSSFLFTMPLDLTGSTTSFIPFTSFTGTADPTHLGAVRITLTNPNSADSALQLTAFTPPLGTTVPEPSALGLVATAGLSGLFFTRRRRRAG